MFCSKCGAAHQEGQFCKNCGQPLMVSQPPSKRASSSLFIAITALIIALTGTGLGVFFFLQTPEKQTNMVVEIEKPSENAVEVVKSEPEEKEASINERTGTNGKREIIKEAQSKVFTVFTDSAQGSGFLFNSNGDLVTNAHVVTGYTEVVVKDSNGMEYPGRIIGISDEVDIALIRVIS